MNGDGGVCVMLINREIFNQHEMNRNDKAQAWEQMQPQTTKGSKGM